MLDGHAAAGIKPGTFFFPDIFWRTRNNILSTRQNVKAATIGTIPAQAFPMVKILKKIYKINIAEIAIESNIYIIYIFKIL